MLTCKDVQTHLSDAHEGHLTGWRRVSYRFHLWWCPFCKRAQGSFYRTMKTLKLMRDVPPSEQVCGRDAHDHASGSTKNEQ
jgi:hypothetical protein